MTSVDTLLTGIRTRTASLRWRLPALILALLAAIACSFAWSAYREVYRVLAIQGDQRVRGAAVQLADMLAQSAAGRLADCRRLASDAAVRRFVETGETAEAALAALRAFGERNPLATITLSARGGTAATRLQAQKVTVERSPNALDGLEKQPAEGISTLQATSGRVTYHTHAVVSAPDAHTAAKGVLSIERNLSSASGVALIQRLMGSGATLKLGNSAGDVWTDFSGRVDPPPGVAQGAASVSYVDRAGVKRLGNAVAVAGTPWLVWVDFDEAALFEPAAMLLRRMLPVTLLLIALGVVGVYATSARMTRPIQHLADAAEAIAAGDYSRRVVIKCGDEMGRLAAAFNTMAARVEASHETLETEVRERTRDLAAMNRELEAFSYSVSHDLRAPLRSIDGFSQAVSEDCADRLGPEGQEHLSRIRRAAQHMGQLIDDLLKLARVTRAEMQWETIDVSAMAADVIAALRSAHPERTIDCQVQPGLRAVGDPRLVQIVLTNLLQNAWKFTAKRDRGRIEFGARANGGATVYYVGDNGAGFDMAYAGKLFGTFQRLHHQNEFAGTGIGLATVQRIVARHRGRIWAEGKVNEGATFSFTLQPETHA